MPIAVTLPAARSSKRVALDLRLGLVFAMPIATLLLAFAISTRGPDETVRQTLEQVAFDQI